MRVLGAKPWLLEVNESPNLRNHGSATLEPMLDGLLDIVLGETGPKGSTEAHDGARAGQPRDCRNAWRCVH